MRRLLDGLYAGSGAVAAAFIALICVLVSSQVLMNLITRFGGRDINLTIPSYADFAGYFLASASFLALAYTLNQGGHIRVSLLTGRLPPTMRFVSELFSLIIGSGAVVTATVYMIKLVIESWRFGDVSPGLIAVPTWIPQTAVAAGLLILSIALLDMTVRTLRSRAPVLEDSENA